MDDPTENPVPVKVEEQSQSLILTYFHGDISSMVDAHFRRALNKVTKTKTPARKLNRPTEEKRIHKKIKSEESSDFQESPTDTYPAPQVRPVTEHLVMFGSTEDPCSSWHGFPRKTGEGPALPSITCTQSHNGLSVTGQQCSTSLLNLLNADRTEMPPSGLSSVSKADLLQNWMVPQVDPTAVFEHGHRLDKKDLYWYWGEVCLVDDLRNIIPKTQSDHSKWPQYLCLSNGEQHLERTVSGEPVCLLSHSNSTVYCLLLCYESRWRDFVWAS